ncbi:FRG domain-containing protein [Acinetobacter junii]|uniref:FRG domain-containing protein n=1 Tax=Acinetobacter junii TaxID=40215 RepID=UPI0021CD4D16|nr:FRG domain-containing protein [Acinetobacter junii]MCU4406709.1 FRG domain-containing protein [Acinetobacter junii]
MESIKCKGYTEYKLEFDQFIDIIRPDNKKEIGKLMGSANNLFIYRGQPNSEFELVPSIYRNVLSYSMFSNNYNDLCFLQLSHLKTFVAGCDANAVAIPNDSFAFRENILSSCHDKVFIDTTSWPNRDLYELLAFAQHYGYPTELLDWSYSPLHAMYFAATEVIKKKELNLEGSFSIWVFDKEKRYALKNNFEIVNVPRAHNINISSQEGCFTLVRQSIDPRAPITHENNKIPQLKLITDLMDEFHQEGLIKLTIKNKEVLKVLEFCDHYSVNAAKLFRGPAGAATFANDSIARNKFASKHGLQIHGNMPL